MRMFKKKKHFKRYLARALSIYKEEGEEGVLKPQSTEAMQEWMEANPENFVYSFSFASDDGVMIIWNQTRTDMRL